MHQLPPPTGEGAAERLLAHCAALQRLQETRLPAYRRLERDVGDDLARFLVGALAAHRRERLAA
jgi:hypothetical protein